MERQEAGKVKSRRKDVKWNGEVEEGDVRKRREVRREMMRWKVKKE